MPYIVVVGTTGAGKRRLVQGLKRHFAARDPLVLREPGGTPMTARQGEYLQRHSRTIKPMEQLVLRTADGVMLNIVALRSALGGKRLVLSDQSFLSTIAIQCQVQGASDAAWYLDLLRRLEFPMPDAVLDLVIDPAVACQRRSTSGNQNDFDQQPLSFHQAHRAALDGLPLLLPQVPFYPLDAAQPPEWVLNRAVAIVQPLLSAR